MIGWIAIHRKLVESDEWLSEPFTRGQAWIDLLCLANHKDGFIRVSGQKIPVKRGECGWSLLKLSRRWGWSRGKTKRFVLELEKDGKVVVKQDNRTTILSICNYSKYQDKSHSCSTPDRTPNGHQTDTRQDTNNNDNNDNNDNKIEGVALRKAVEMYNSCAKKNNLPQCQRLTEARKKQLNLRLKEVGGIDGWKVLIEKIENSDFLLGRNERGWKVDFDFTIRQSSFTKIMEGKYDGRAKQSERSIDEQERDILDRLGAS